MCGLVGWVSPNGVDEAVLRRMATTLVHRGPDAEGFYLSPDHSVGFGHRRLCVIDLAGGAQPMSNEDGTVWTITNGEIYNFRELRESLREKGHCFRTRSDTEVIVHAFEEYGEACVEHFNGMFSFAVYEERRKRLFIARDRFGEKPLYYCLNRSGLLFASEIKALLAHPSVSPDLDLRAFARYLTHEYVPNPHSIFLGVRKLPPAHRMTYDVETGRLEISRYWDLEFEPKVRISEAEACEEFLSRLKESLRLRLVSDVPLGVLLSGGIDSSTVVALLRELVPSQKIKTFNIAFQEESFDESPYAREVARRFETDHHEEVFSIPKMFECLQEILPRIDEPFADASLLPTYLLSGFARSMVTVVLGGDGCDELLAGYPTFYASRYAEYYKRSPRLVRSVMEWSAARLPVSTADFSFDFKLRQFLKGIPFDEPQRTQVWLGSFTPGELDDLLSEDVKRHLEGFDSLEDLASLEETRRASNGVWLDRLVYQYVHSYLADDILFKVDRASMACSLEVRAPFLDHTLAEFLCRLPSKLRMKGRTGKYILKKMMAERLPRRILHRRKKGFGIPIAKWLKNSLMDLADEELSADKLRREGLFNPGHVARLLGEHRAGRRNHRKQLWTILVFQLWARDHLR